MSSPVDKGILFDGINIQEGGVQEEVVILPYEVWKRATVSVDGTTKEITGIVLTKTGDVGFKWQVPKGSNILPTHALRTQDGADGYDHSIEMRLQTIEQLDQDNISKIRFNKVVVIPILTDGRKYLVGGGVNPTPEAVGVGLRLTEDDGSISDAATGGTSHFIAATDPNQSAEINKPHLIAKTFDVETLLTPVA